MSLFSLIDNTLTDKNTFHSYLETYEQKFSHYKYTAKRVLEIGVYKGGSINLWHDYFTNADIYGLDIQSEQETPEFIKNNERIHLYSSTDAYDIHFLQREFIDKGITFDIVIDDGPHSLSSMVFFAEHFSKLLSPGGLLVVEDIPQMDWVNVIISSLPGELQSSVEIVDLRSVKERWDDILLFATRKF